MMRLPKPLEKLIEHFESLPGIGRKTAERLAFYFLKANKSETESFANSLLDVKDTLSLCQLCGNVAEGKLCEVCLDDSRDRNTIIVVENVLNLIAIEKTGYNGLYHVLHGVLNPINGVNPEDLNFDLLFKRVQDPSIYSYPAKIAKLSHGQIAEKDSIDSNNSAIEQVNSKIDVNNIEDSKAEKWDNTMIEVILATNPTMEGESTAMYIKRKINQEDIKNVKITRIGRGIPTGGDIEYADRSTLDNALQARKDF